MYDVLAQLQFYAILCYFTEYTFIFTTGFLKMLQEMIVDLPAISHNRKLLAKFHSVTLRIMDTMRMMSLL